MGDIVVGVIAEPLSIIFERSWRTGEVPEEWRKASVTPVFKKGKKEDPGNYRVAGLTSIPGKVMEQLILEVIWRKRRLLGVVSMDSPMGIMLNQSDSFLQWHDRMGRGDQWMLSTLISGRLLTLSPITSS